MRNVLALTVGALLVGGCHDDGVVTPRDTNPPAAPRGVHSVTGDHEVFLTWLDNTEPDVVAYRIFIGDCGELDCPYDPVGVTQQTSFVVTGLANGQTRYFAVAAVDRAGNESELSYDGVFDTPRPEGFDLQLSNYLSDSLRAGYDFSAYAIVSYHAPGADVFYGANGGQSLIIAPFVDTDIQDAGYASSLDAVDYAPTAGWSPTGAVEAIVGHCYIVHTHDNHYAKFRVTSAGSSRVTVDWAYQVDPNNRELHMTPESPAPRILREFHWPSTAVAAEERP